MACILLSFPVSVLFYAVLVGNTKLGILNVMSLYIIMGIGVDDAYVFLDAFKQLSDSSDKISMEEFTAIFAETPSIPTSKATSTTKEAKKKGSGDDY